MLVHEACVSLRKVERDRAVRREGEVQFGGSRPTPQRRRKSSLQRE